MTVEAGPRPVPAPVPEGPEAPPPSGPQPDPLGLDPVLIAGNAAEELAVDSSSQRAVRGGAFALTGHLIVQVLRMGGQIVLTRLVPQEAFGLMAIVHTFRAAVDLFSDIGIGPSIIQNPRGDEPRFLDTAWTLQLLRGTGLFLFACVCALPVAKFYGHPELGALIPAASASAIIAGLRSTKSYSAERHLRLGLLTLSEVLAQAAALITMVVWAFYSPTVWALVAGGLMGATVDVALGHLIMPGYNGKPGWDKAALKAMGHFGKWIFLSTVLTFAVNEADRLVFGKMVSLAELGVYNVALTIASIPLSAMQSLAAKVIFPLFSRIHQTRDELARVFGQARRLHLVISGWMLSGLIGGGTAAVGLIYDDRYQDGGWMLQLLAVGAWISTPETTNSSANLACGHPRWVAAANLGKLLGMIVLLPIGYEGWGFRGALIAYATAELFRYATSTAGVYQRGLRTLRQDAGFTLVVVVSSACAMYVMNQLNAHGVGVWLRALSVFVVVSLLWMPWLFPYLRDLWHRLEARFGW